MTISRRILVVAGLFAAALSCSNLTAGQMTGVIHAVASAVWGS